MGDVFAIEASLSGMPSEAAQDAALELAANLRAEAKALLEKES